MACWSAALLVSVRLSQLTRLATHDGPQLFCDVADERNTRQWPVEQRIVITVLSERVTSEETDVQAGWAAPYKSSKTDLETSPRPWERRPADQNRRRSSAPARGTGDSRAATVDTIIHSILPSVQIDYCYMNLVMRAIKTLSEWRNTRVATNYKPGRANLFLSTEHH